jgi:hypothetical protein
MFDELVFGSEFFDELLAVDGQIAEAVRRARCARCGGPLHRGDYERKPRGGMGWTLGAAFSRRFSFCCGWEGCRRRSTPPSLRFLGRRVYVEAMVIAACVVAQAVLRAKEVQRITEVPPRTIRRWLSWWSGSFARSAVFVDLCARFVGLRGESLPTSLIEMMPGAMVGKLGLIFRWLAPLTTTSATDGSSLLRVIG